MNKKLLFSISVIMCGFISLITVTSALAMQVNSGGVYFAKIAPVDNNRPAGSVPEPGSTSKKNACDGLAQLDSTQSCDTGAGKVTNVVKTAVSILSYIVGIAAVIMVILAGFKYTTSGGDSNKISSAKTTLVYALVGLVVAALAQVLVHTVINDSANVSKTAHNSVSAPARFTA